MCSWVIRCHRHIRSEMMSLHFGMDCDDCLKILTCEYKERTMSRAKSENHNRPLVVGCSTAHNLLLLVDVVLKLLMKVSSRYISYAYFLFTTWLI